VNGYSGILVPVNRNAIRWVLFFGILSIVGILGVQVFFIRQAISREDRQLNQTITIALSAVAERLAEYNDAELPYQNPVFRYSQDYYIVNVNGDINPDILEQFLVTEFQTRGIKIDFEYGIYNCRTDEMVYGRLVRFGDNVRIHPMDQAFPKHSDYLYYFGIHFVGRSDALASSMGIWYFFSLILIIVVIFFTYTQWIILRQRRYAEIQRDFINTMTHEFKTPLASLAMSADVILKPEIVTEPERLKKYSQIIRSQVNHLLGQVDKVLEMGGQSGDKMILNKEPVNLESLAREVIQQAETRLHTGQGTIRLNYHSGILTVQADRLHLANVLLNLIDNSINYSGDHPVITLTVQENDGGIEITVTDKGTGIPKEYIRRVFDRFYRVPTGNIHKVKGFGLGLYYVRNVVRAHRWRISLDSEPGKGTRIVIRIPKKRF